MKTKHILIFLFCLAGFSGLGANEQKSEQKPSGELWLEEAMDNRGICISDYEMDRVLYWCSRCEKWREKSHICPGK